MLCAKSFELVKQLDANLNSCHELSAYNEDNVRFSFEECKTLFAQNQIDVQPVLQGLSQSYLFFFFIKSINIKYIF